MDELDLLTDPHLDSVEDDFQAQGAQVTDEPLEIPAEEDQALNELGLAPEEPIEGSDLNQAEEDAITLYLKGLGVNDPTKILWDNEDGSGPQEVSFFDLPKEDQLDILQANTVEKALDAEEINAINFFRENNTTLEDYTKYVERQAIERYLASQEMDLTIDAISDEDLYKADLQNKYPNQSQEAIEKKWNLLQQDPELLKQEINLIREEYRALEAQERQERDQSASLEYEKQFSALADQIKGISAGVESIEDIILEDSDKQKIEDLILKKDINGITGIAKALNDPQTLYMAAWFLTQGSDAFNMLKTHYTEVVEEEKKKAYAAGKKAALSPQKPQQRQASTPLVQTRQPKNERPELGKNFL